VYISWALPLRIFVSSWIETLLPEVKTVHAPNGEADKHKHQQRDNAPAHKFSFAN
jgi:hypothetical protein